MQSRSNKTSKVPSPSEFERFEWDSLFEWFYREHELLPDEVLDLPRTDLYMLMFPGKTQEDGKTIEPVDTVREINLKRAAKGEKPHIPRNYWKR